MRFRRYPLPRLWCRTHHLLRRSRLRGSRACCCSKCCLKLSRKRYHQRPRPRRSDRGLPLHPGRLRSRWLPPAICSVGHDFGISTGPSRASEVKLLSAFSTESVDGHRKICDVIGSRQRTGGRPARPRGAGCRLQRTAARPADGKLIERNGACRRSTAIDDVQRRGGGSCSGISGTTLDGASRTSTRCRLHRHCYCTGACGNTSNEIDDTNSPSAAISSSAGNATRAAPNGRSHEVQRPAGYHINCEIGIPARRTVEAARAVISCAARGQIVDGQSALPCLREREYVAGATRAAGPVRTHWTRPHRRGRWRKA